MHTEENQVCCSLASSSGVLFGFNVLSVRVHVYFICLCMCIQSAVELTWNWAKAASGQKTRHGRAIFKSPSLCVLIESCGLLLCLIHCYCLGSFGLAEPHIAIHVLFLHARWVFGFMNFLLFDDLDRLFWFFAREQQCLVTFTCALLFLSVCILCVREIRLHRVTIFWRIVSCLFHFLLLFYPDTFFNIFRDQKKKKLLGMIKSECL